MSIINSVDVVLLTLTGERQERRLCVALLKRESAPFEGLLALPGGYVHPEVDRDAKDAAQRTLKSKTGIDANYLEQLGAWSGPNRDPRGWSVSVVYFALVAPDLISSSDDLRVQLVAVDQVNSLPFDHKEILQAAVDRVRSKSAYSTLAAHFCGDNFTLGEMQSVYEAVLGSPIPRVSFRRQMMELDAIEEVRGLKRSDGGRPAQVYRLKRAYRTRLSVLDRGLGWQS